MMQLQEASVLIVDDESTLLEILGAWFHGTASQVFSAENGVQALQVLAARKIDLIVTDLHMPGMDGISLLKDLKASARYIPSVIFLTSFTDVLAREAYSLGAAAFLEKPIERADLIAAARVALAERDEIWRTPAGVASQPALVASFDSLATELREHRIAFGRGGFCIETEEILTDGPLNFELTFKADRYVLAGQGIVRWLDCGTNQAGIELIHVAENSRARTVQLTGRADSFIPSTTGHTYQARTG